MSPSQQRAIQPFQMVQEPGQSFGGVWCGEELMLYHVRLPLALKVCQLMNFAYMRGRAEGGAER